jgi:glycosyltransferase involved in cell wall biosynthesis
MRILHVITDLTTGGAQMMLLRLLSVGNREWESAVVSLKDEGTVGRQILSLGIPVHGLGMHRVGPSPFRAVSLVHLARSFRPQLIQGWMYHGDLVASFAAIISQGRVPVLWNIRQTLYNLSTERRLTAAVIRIGGLISQHPAAIIYNSVTSATQHEALGYRAAKRVIIPNGFDCRVFRPDDEARRQVRAELGLENNSVLIGLIARYHPMKDHAGFMCSAALVARTHPNVHFLLAGSGVTLEDPVLRNLIAQQGLGACTHLLGERSDTPRLISALDIACSNSAWGEGFSNAIGEAMACGVPCVVTDVGDSARIVANTGLSVPPRDLQAMAQAIGELIDAGAPQRTQMGKAARKRIEMEFSLPAVVRRYEELYREHVALGPFAEH